MIGTIISYLARIDSSLLVIIITSLAGSYGKDYLRIMKSTQPEKVSLQTILLSTFMATLTVYGFTEILISRFGERTLPVVSFVCGLIGFPLMKKLSTLDGVIWVIEKVVNILVGIYGGFRKVDNFDRDKLD